MNRKGFRRNGGHVKTPLDGPVVAGDGLSAAAVFAALEDPAVQGSSAHGTAEGVATEAAGRLPGLAYRLAKRAFDVAGSLSGLLVFAALLPGLGLAIKLDSPGPVFYSQERVGLNRRRRQRPCGSEERRKILQPGRPFRIFKLRTMRNDAEAAGPQWASEGDARITRVGRFLRKTRLDELPQLWNVLKGDMSLIGPRPERLCFIRQLENEVPHYHERLLVKPGLTGLAQVRNGYDDSLDSVRRKVELDRQYIQRCGPLTEAGILLRTVRVVLKGEGAH
jgi:lipopolysaccharide/colanic/teichoic acid biosynthesis glycosyltransferase